MKQKIKKVQFNDKIAVGLSGVLGIIVFLLIYGPYSLDVTNEAWILSQYDGPDIIQNYAGWTQYRISDWAYPLGYAGKLAYGDGTYITYTDSIPYLAIIFKLFRNVLPPVFQYFGWFTLLCFALQGIGACLLLKRKFRSYTIVMVGSIFFLTAPILIERAFKHTALGAQWLILFAMYSYLQYKDSEKKKMPWQLIFLAVLTIGIHPYFLPMVMIFVLLTVVEAVRKSCVKKKIAGYCACSLMFPYLSGLLIGAVGVEIKHTTRTGYGSFGMNLNSLFNPRSYGGFLWSQILKQREWALSTYEGFNYLGLGILAMAALCLILFLVKLILEKEYKSIAIRKIISYIPLIIVMLFMTLFAVTNHVTWDDKILISIPLPQKIIELACIFRSSGRMFYPVYYLIILCLIYALLTMTGKKWGKLLLLLFLVIQVYDMRAVFQEKYACMKENYARETIMDDDTLKNISGKDVLVWIGTENFEVQRVLTVWAANHNMGVSYSIANTGIYNNSELYMWEMEGLLEHGILKENVVYVTIDEEIMQGWRETLSDQEYTEYKRGFYYFVYKE